MVNLRSYSKVAEYLSVLICGTVSKVDVGSGERDSLFTRGSYAGVKEDNDWTFLGFR